MKDPTPTVPAAMARVGERQIAVTTHGHYLEVVPPGPGPHPLLVGFHGYAETVEDHLAELRRIPGTGSWLVVAVQGLSAFYRGRTGEVVASWMTRRNRELAIADNIAYVGAVVGDIKARHPVGETLVYAGFSQGVAMTFRAAAGSGHRPRGVIALAGDVPPEVGAGDLAGFPPVLLGRGEQDGGYPRAQLERDVSLLESKGVSVVTLTFPGGHQWTDPFRQEAGHFLARIRS